MKMKFQKFTFMVIYVSYLFSLRMRRPLSRTPQGVILLVMRFAHYS